MNKLVFKQVPSKLSYYYYSSTENISTKVVGVNTKCYEKIFNF